MPGSFKTILICGHGIAFEMTVAALMNNLPESVAVTALEIANQVDHDAFYGNVTSPLAFDFHLSMGIDEPTLLQNTDTSFSYGTQYENWANELEWVQAHHLPFPVWNNVQFHHYLRRLGKTIEPYLVSAVAGREGVFAHPPRDDSVPISRAEYGYQFRPRSIADFLKAYVSKNNLHRENGEIGQVHTDNGNIASLELADGRQLTADLYIDATGSASQLMSALKNRQTVTRTLGVIEEDVKPEGSVPPLRKLTGRDYGWQSTTHLRGKNSVLTVYHPGEAEHARSEQIGELKSEFLIPVGKRQKGWAGNCVGIGHVNCVMEPLTPAPMMLLQLDIQRLLSLLPVSLEMSVEANEFNRLLANDVEHCELFNQSFFQIAQCPNTVYWQSAKSSSVSSKLERKITQFQSRGYIATFDFEPFNEQDWTILHFGLGRVSDRYDVFVDNIPEATIREKLDELQSSINQIIKKMPPHQRYIDNFLNYLERKHGR